MFNKKKKKDQIGGFRNGEEKRRGADWAAHLNGESPLSDPLNPGQHTKSLLLLLGGLLPDWLTRTAGSTEIGRAFLFSKGEEETPRKFWVINHSPGGMRGGFRKKRPKNVVCVCLLPLFFYLKKKKELWNSDPAVPPTWTMMDPKRAMDLFSRPISSSLWCKQELLFSRRRGRSLRLPTWTWRRIPFNGFTYNISFLPFTIVEKKMRQVLWRHLGVRRRRLPLPRYDNVCRQLKLSGNQVIKLHFFFLSFLEISKEEK